MANARQNITTACQDSTRLSKRSLLANLANSDPVRYTLKPDSEKTEAEKQANSIVFVEKKHFLETIDYDSWEIVSFNPSTKKVCIRINLPSGIKNISLTLPYSL